MNKINKFLMSNVFIAIVFAVNVLLWWLEQGIIMMSLSVLLLILIISFNLNRQSIIPIALANIINFRVAKLEDNLVLMIVFGTIIAPFLFYDLFRKYKIDLKDKTALALLIFLGVNILSLINTNSNTFGLGLIGIVQVVLYIFIYLYFSKYNEKDSFIYISKNACAMGVAIFLQLMLKILEFGGQEITKNEISLGWGMSNYISMVVTTLIPLTFYLYMRNQENKYTLLVVGLEFIVIIITQSKGAILAWALVSIPFLVMAFKYAKNKKTLVIDGLLFLGAVLIGIFFVSRIDSVWEGIVDYFESMSTRGWFNDENRIRNYKLGFSLFKEYPILGAGSYSGQYYLEIIINYHNYIIQTIATLGLLGLGSFGYLLVSATKKVLNKHYFSISVLFIIILFSIHGLVDTTWYNPMLMIIFFMVIALVPKKNETLDKEDL